MSVTYYPIFSGVQNLTGSTSAWASAVSSDFTDQTTGATVAASKRFQKIRVTNTSSVAAMVSWAKDVSTLDAQSASAGIPLGAGEELEYEICSLGASVGVGAVGVRVDPDLTTSNLGSGVDATTVAVYAEFGNT